MDTVPDSGMIYLKSQKLPPASCRGPAAYVVTAADMRPRRGDNVIIKYADDTYLIVPFDNSDTVPKNCDISRHRLTGITYA